MNITNTLEESLECSICSVLFKDPKQLHCGHTFCLACIQKMMKPYACAFGTLAVVCPHCREQTIVPPQGLRTNFLIGEMAAKMNEVHQQTQQTEDAPVCSTCQLVLPKEDVAICRTCVNVYLCCRCVLKYHRDHDIEFMDACIARRRVANARAYIRSQRNERKYYVEYITHMCADDHIAKEGRVEEEVREIFAEFDVLIKKLGDSDEDADITLTPHELCALIHHSNQISCTIDGIFSSAFKLVQSICMFSKEVTTGKKSTVNRVSQPNPTELQKLMTVLDAGKELSKTRQIPSRRQTKKGS